MVKMRQGTIDGLPIVRAWETFGGSYCVVTEDHSECCEPGRGFGFVWQRSYHEGEWGYIWMPEWEELVEKSGSCIVWELKPGPDGLIFMHVDAPGMSMEGRPPENPCQRKEQGDAEGDGSSDGGVHSLPSGVPACEREG
jgi:hypothetical protein